MAGLLQTLMHPDHDDAPERGLVAAAANILQVGEFQLLQLAYYDWFGVDLPPETSHHIFNTYMLRNEVPIWARNYAQRIIKMDKEGKLDGNLARYHRYDSDYFRASAQGGRRLTLVVLGLGGLLLGGLALSSITTKEVTSVLPPFFNEDELVPGQRSE